MSNDTSRKVLQAERERRGNKCQMPGCQTTTGLEFHHTETTAVRGRGRGLNQRAYDIKNNPGSYTLLCRPHHKAMHPGIFPNGHVHVVLDTETTGLGHKNRPPRDDAIIEIGIAYEIDGELYTWGSLCYPGSQYFAEGRADQALSVSHIDRGEIEKADSSDLVSLELRHVLQKIDETALAEGLDGIVLHSYNIPFDRPFLEKDPWHVVYPWGLDVMNLASDYFNFRAWQGNISLNRAAERLEIHVRGQPHRAVRDAVTALEIYKQLIVTRRP